MTRLEQNCEIERLAALQSLAIVDTGPELQFDAICRYACKFFQVPIAYIAFIDEGRQWLKAACGMSLLTVPRSGTFCSHAILLDRVLVVEDAAADPRFASNLYVSGPPHIRFYAGAPITLTPDIRVGTLCLIDTVPRSFSMHRAEALRGLAEYVVERLQIRLKQQDARDTSAVAPTADGAGKMGQVTASGSPSPGRSS